MRKIFLATLTGAIAFAACKKNDDNNTASIVGKWNGVNVINTHYYNDSSYLDTSATAGQVIEFTSDGKCYYDGDTSTYSVAGNTLSIIYTDNHGVENELYQIQALDAHNLGLYMNETDSSNGKAHVYQTWANFSR
jgi:hypothetical protein